MSGIWGKIRQFLVISGTRGLYVPHIYDAARQTPSIPLLFTLVSFSLAAGSIVALHLDAGLLSATVTAICFFALCYVLSMFREVDRLKLDLTKRQIEVDNDTVNDASAQAKSDEPS